MQHTTRNFGLDIIRAIAILSVVCCHLIPVFYHHMSGFAEVGFNFITWAGGYYGVELFFVLSGFLIGTIFIRNVVQTVGSDESVSLGPAICDFWLRRWFRTLPNYLLFLLINYLLIGISDMSVSPDILLRFLFFLQGIVHLGTPFYGVSWSLAIEEWFYLVLPLVFMLALLFVKRKHAATAFLAAMAFLLLLPVGLKLGLIARLPAYANVEDAFHYRTFLKLDSIFYGLLMAWLWSRDTVRPFLVRHKKMLFAIGLLLLCGSFAYALLFVLKPLQQTILVFLFGPLCSIAIFLCFPFMLELKVRATHPLIAPVRFVSLSSYSLYLCHVPVLYLVRYIAQQYHFPDTLFQEIVYCLLILAISFTLAQLLYTYFELPVLNQRDRISRRLNRMAAFTK